MLIVSIKSISIPGRVARRTEMLGVWRVRASRLRSIPAKMSVYLLNVALIQPPRPFTDGLHIVKDSGAYAS